MVHPESQPRVVETAVTDPQASLASLLYLVSKPQSNERLYFQTRGSWWRPEEGHLRPTPGLHTHAHPVWKQSGAALLLRWLTSRGRWRSATYRMVVDNSGVAVEPRSASDPGVDVDQMFTFGKVLLHLQSIHSWPMPTGSLSRALGCQRPKQTVA